MLVYLKGNALRREKRRIWLLRRNQRLLVRRRRKTLISKRLKNTVLGIVLSKHTQQSVSRYRDRLVIELPERLDFDDCFETTVTHFHALREAVRKSRRVASLVFDKIQYISPSAALVLASEVDRWNKKVGGRLKANHVTWHEDIKRLLCQMGYFELLDLPKPTVEFPPKNDTFLPFKRESILAQDKGKVAVELRKDIEHLVGTGINSHLLYEGLSEAITNVGQHAYNNPQLETLECFWLSAAYDSKERVLKVTFYDQGEGIPRTLHNWKFYERIAALFHKLTDSKKIEAAMEIGRSSTGLVERGKGLQNLLEFAQSYEVGSLSIYSLRGLYRMESKRVNDKLEVTTHLRDHNHSIGGTLIEWSVKI